MKIKRFNENIEKDETIDKEISDKIYEQNVDPNGNILYCNQRIMMLLSEIRDILKDIKNNTMNKK
jgi:hypothetical protein